MLKELARTSKQTIKQACRTKHNTAQYLFTMQQSSISKYWIQEIFFQWSLHSRPQSPSFLGHVVGKRLQIKPSGSGDENVIFSSLEALARARYTQICSVQIWCKKVQTRRKSKAKIVNIAFAYRFTRGCKFVGKCGIYHLCLWFPADITFIMLSPQAIVNWLNALDQSDFS